MTLIFVETPEMLTKIYDLVRFKGLDSHDQISKALGMSRTTYYTLRMAPDSNIDAVAAQAKEDIVTSCHNRILDIAEDPENKQYFNANTFIIQRHDKRVGANKVTVQVQKTDDLSGFSPEQLESALLQSEMH
jgi:hypothetical protein